MTRSPAWESVLKPLKSVMITTLDDSYYNFKYLEILRDEKLALLQAAVAQGQMEVCWFPEPRKHIRSGTDRKYVTHWHIRCAGAREGYKVVTLCPGRAVYTPVILTFEVFWLRLVHRVNRFAGSLTLGQRLCDLLLFRCCVPWFAGLCFWSWTLPLRTGGRKVATAEKNNLMSIESLSFCKGWSFILNGVPKIWMSYSVFKSHQKHQSGKKKKDAETSPSYANVILGIKREREIAPTCWMLRSQWNWVFLACLERFLTQPEPA